MRRAILVLTIAVTAALVAPLAAHGDTRDDDGLRVRLQLPVTFSDPTPQCLGGTAEYRITSKRRTGSGSNCILGVVPADCPPTVEALFCQEVSVLVTLRLRGGRIEADVSIFEIWTCGDPACLTLSVDQRWSGTVTRATGRFDDFEEGSISGGGTAVFDATTFQVLSIDQVLVIGEQDEEEEDD